MRCVCGVRVSVTPLTNDICRHSSHKLGVSAGIREEQEKEDVESKTRCACLCLWFSLLSQELCLLQCVAVCCSVLVCCSGSVILSLESRVIFVFTWFFLKSKMYVRVCVCMCVCACACACVCVVFLCVPGCFSRPHQFHVVWSRPYTSESGSRHDPPFLSILILHSLMDLVVADQLILPVVCTDANQLSNCSANMTKMLLCCSAFASLNQKSLVVSSRFHCSICSTYSAKGSHN